MSVKKSDPRNFYLDPETRKNNSQEQLSKCPGTILCDLLMYQLEPDKFQVEVKDGVQVVRKYGYSVTLCSYCCRLLVP